ncbi:unnamed protein product [Acanthosepion pharaonis]|uniref:Uncharacterized protein n=1 Tax=Acanthosepion pharaonis TaxID=158019 RepID=A0A812CZU2_ACAPH|nr:unnamed protein product [Sepia pharaonis]
MADEQKWRYSFAQISSFFILILFFFRLSYNLFPSTFGLCFLFLTIVLYPLFHRAPSYFLVRVIFLHIIIFLHLFIFKVHIHSIIWYFPFLCSIFLRFFFVLILLFSLPLSSFHFFVSSSFHWKYFFLLLLLLLFFFSSSSSSSSILFEFISFSSSSSSFNFFL